MNASIATCLCIALPLICEARPVPHWTPDQLAEKADLVVIATPAGTRETKERMDIPGLFRAGSDHVCRPVPGVGLETTFDVQSVVKGSTNITSFVLFHLREANPPTILVNVNGPGLVSFDTTQQKTYLLFLKRETDGRYSALTGQTDPDGAITEIHTPVATNDYARFADLPETNRSRIVWELHDRHAWGLPEQKPVCRDILVTQGYSGGNATAWTIGAIDLAEEQKWKELSTLITSIYERPRNIWIYKRAFCYLRSEAGRPVSTNLIADAETLAAAGSYQSRVTDAQLSAAKDRLVGEPDKDAIMVYAITVAGWHAGKGGTDRGRKAAVDVLGRLDRNIVVRRIRQLHKDGDELAQSEIEWVARSLNMDMGTRKAP